MIGDMVIGGRFSIAVADDEPMIRDGLAESIPWEDLGFQILGPCKNGAEVIELLRQRPVHAIISDIRMQPCGGIELARLVREEAPHIRLLFLTAYSEFAYAKAAVDYGVWRYIVKPIEFESLLETMRELYYDLDRSHPLSTEKEASHLDPLVREVDEYAASHFNRASLAEIAGKLGLSGGYVSKAYYERSGRHFSELVRSLRMQEAAKLLRETRYRVAEISGIVGYANPKNFSRGFHAHFGLSPREYRMGRNRESQTRTAERAE